MELRPDARWAVAVPTSVGVRLTPEDHHGVHHATRFRMQATSAETNAASVASFLGLPVAVLTNFVEGSPIAAFIKADLRSRGMTLFGPDIPAGGPWGHRHQFNLADTGYGARGPRVWNDRAGEVGRELDAADFDLDQIFDVDGVQVVHLSGMVASLSPKSVEFSREVARRANASGTVVSFDLNYRASLWEGREAELRSAFEEIAATAGILFGNSHAFRDCLGIEILPDGTDAVVQSRAAIDALRSAYPRAEWVGASIRESESASRHRWGLVLWGNGGFEVADPREIDVLDRIGGGDGAAGGLLYGILKGWSAERCLQFAWATGVLASTTLDDHASPADEAQIWSIWAGNAAVQR